MVSLCAEAESPMNPPLDTGAASALGTDLAQHVAAHDYGN
jgi:hypothetical protein